MADNKAIVTKWVDEAWNGRQGERIDEMFAPDYVGHFPGMPDLHGPGDFKGFHASFMNALPDMHLAVEDLVSEGDRVVWRFVVTGTHAGELLGVPATGKRVRFDVMVLTRLTDGRWSEDWVQMDTLGLLQQIGAIPAPEFQTA